MFVQKNPEIVYVISSFVRKATLLISSFKEFLFKYYIYMYTAEILNKPRKQYVDVKCHQAHLLWSNAFKKIVMNLLLLEQ